MGDLNCLFKPVADRMNPFGGCRSLDISEKKHGSFIHIVHLGGPSVNSLIEFPCCHEFFSPLVVSVVNEWGIAHKSVPWRSSLRISWLGNVSSRVSSAREPTSSSAWESAASSSGWTSTWRSEYRVSRWRESHWWTEVNGSANPWVAGGIWSVWACCPYCCSIVCGEYSSSIWVYGSNLGGRSFCDDGGTHLLC